MLGEGGADRAEGRSTFDAPVQPIASSETIITPAPRRKKIIIQLSDYGGSQVQSHSGLLQLSLSLSSELPSEFPPFAIVILKKLSGLWGVRRAKVCGIPFEFFSGSESDVAKQNRFGKCA